MSITLTDRAARRIREYIARHGEAVGLRVGVKQTGCSGWSYTIDYADAVGSDDVVVEDQGIKLVVSNSALSIIDGSRIDYIREGLNEKFAFENPNATGECGCGESFSV
jgi:iron-sulfur cluster assembly protein